MISRFLEDCFLDARIETAPRGQALVERCLRIHSWREARETFRAALAKRAR
jgi:hypothetical protein